MGKGDKKTRRGKIYRSSHGNVRPHKAGAKPVGQSVGPSAAAAKAPAKRAVRRTAVRKKAS